MLEGKQLRNLKAAAVTAAPPVDPNPASGPTASGNDVRGNKDM